MVRARFTKLKITIGYILLLSGLLFSLIFVYREMETLSAADDQENLRTDSLMTLLGEKDKNTLQMLRILSEANDSLLSASEIEEIITEQDSVFKQQRIQNRVIIKRDSLIAPPKKKGFFRRLADAFSSSNKDSALLVKTSREVASDTIIHPLASADSLQEKLRAATEDKQLKRKKTVRRTSTKYQTMNAELTARVDSLITSFEVEMTLRANKEAKHQQEVRLRSTRIIGGIAAGAVLLSAFFLILIMRDISRSNRYRLQLEEANKRAEHLLAAREKLMLAITHDFKAPLSSIMGYTDLLSRLTEDERQQFYLKNMRGSSEHLLKLVTDLLDFHRLDLNKAEINRVAFLPDRLFDEIRISFEPIVAAKGLRFSCNIATELNGSYISDPLRIRQIVDNLLSNAIKFTSAGEISLIVEYMLPKLIITVADTGKGMEPEDKERIFREFTRLPGAQGEEGFGLGLSIVSKLVTLLNGTIDVESTMGEGSKFIVVLPLFPSSEKPQDISTTIINNSLGVQTELGEDKNKVIAKSMRILLIDDDKIQLNLTAAMLGQYGIETVCCQQIDELIDQLRSSTFDVLLTDIQMPAMNGFDLVKMLRSSNIQQAKTIPIIAVTARNEMDAETLSKHGFAGCLHKPFSMEELFQILQSMQLIKESVEPIENRSLNEALPKAIEVASGQSDAPSLFNFSAITAFSGDDIEEARSMIDTFIQETEKNKQSMKQALSERNVDGIAALAHKLLPLFTLIGVDNVVPILTSLEAKREKEFTIEIEQNTEKVLHEMDVVLAEARRYVLL